ncbi:MAG: hypothetical protein GY866_41020 [Proteobacteria bacterium]|nr:hypothetical protein [Pseudomonadota bacterium]
MTTINRFLNSSRSIWLVLLLHFTIWMLATLILDIHPDMADHWVWSRFLSFGYYEHPPMIALTMKLATLIGGSNELTLEVGSVLFSVLILLLCYRVGSVFFERRTALIFVLILESTPYFSAGSVFWHIDQPYMACWLAGLYIVGRYIDDNNPNWLFGLGLILGLGGLSKYNMVLFPVGLAIWCIRDTEGRKLFVNWKTYVAASIALLIVFPNIYWNYRHEWITFNFIFKKGLTGAVFGADFLQFVVSQTLLFSLVSSVYFWWNLIRGKIGLSSLAISTSTGTRKRSFILVFGLFPFLFFAVSTFFGSHSDPHWVNVSYFCFFLLLSRLVSQKLLAGDVGKQIKIFTSAYILNFLLIGFILVQIAFRVLPLPLSETTSLKKLVGWRDTADRIEEVFQKHGLSLPEYVISREYQLASGLAFYMRNKPMPHSIEKPERNLWSPVPLVGEKGAFLVCPPKECRRTVDKTKTRFPNPIVRLGNVLTTISGKKIREYDIYLLSPFNALKPKPPKIEKNDGYIPQSNK